MQRIIDETGTVVAVILNAREYEGLTGCGLNGGFPKRIADWSISRDAHGKFRAGRRINGATKSVYLGGSLSGAGERLQAIYESSIIDTGT